MPVEQQLRDLRRALQRLAAAVMWRDGVPMPQRKHEQVVDASVPLTVHQPGDQARRVPADFCGGGDAVTGPSDSDGFEDCESPDQPEDQVSRDLAEPVHRQSCRHTYGDAATGPSDLGFTQEQVKSLPRRKEVTWNGWSLACGASLPVVKTFNEEQGTVEHLYCRTDCRCATASDPGRDRRGGFGPT